MESVQLVQTKPGANEKAKPRVKRQKSNETNVLKIYIIC